MARSPRKWADLRTAEPPAPSSTDEPIEQVARRLFCATTDGARVLAWMAETANRVTPPQAPECQLREAEGARRFVAKLHEMIAAPLK